MQTETEKKQKVNKKTLVKNWLLSGRSITARQCSKMFGADRGQDIVFKLRREGMRIESPIHHGKDRFLNDVHYSVYRWLGEIPMIGFDHNSKKVKIYYFRHRYPMSNAKMLKHVQKYLEKIKVPYTGMGFLKKPAGLKRIYCDTRKGTKIFQIEFIGKPEDKK